MKTLSLISLLLLAMAVVFTGCDAAKDAANNVKDKAVDLAGVDFGDFKFDALQEKVTGVTEGFKDVTSENVDGLTSKISDLSGSLGDMGIDKLTGPAKTAVDGVMGKFVAAVEAAMSGISDEGILGKLKPAVAALMEKINGMK